MKTIVENETNLSKFLINDDVVVETTSKNITVGSPADFIIACMNGDNSTVYTNVTNSPDDWAGNKYTFDGTTWTLNPDWIELE